ncbi:protein amnionless [Phlebotomus argentipes]|uniref:protein amnionless n=1 Tax=Phlebotomus argentipes TaxID=94469 RepID=UPI00289366FB|nr:protein amnionless [Phlebotomus argentipes]
MWTQAHLPCADQLILFPAYFYTLLDLPPTLTTKGVVLPSYGSVALPRNGHIDFNLNPSSDCEDKPRDSVARFKRPDTHFWYLSHNWREIDSYGAPMRINKAKPHLNRIPCTYDEVRFPPDRNFAVDLQLAPCLDLAHMKLRDQSVSAEDFDHFLATEVGQMMFKNTEMLLAEHRVISTVDLTADQALCHTSFAYCEPIICYNEKKFCEVPLCLNPIKPVWFCCEICGAMILIEKPDHFDGKKLRGLLEPNLRRLGESDEIDYFLGSVEVNHKMYFQLVITDVGEYDEKSTKLMKALQDSIMHPFQRETANVSFSGRPYKPSKGGSFWNFVFFPLLFVLAMFYSIYSYYYRVEDGKLKVLTWSIPVRAPQRLRSLFSSWNSQFIFARFENTREDCEISVAELQIQPGSSSTNTSIAPGEEIESEIQVAEEEKDEIVENLLQIDLNE